MAKYSKRYNNQDCCKKCNAQKLLYFLLLLLSLFAPSQSFVLLHPRSEDGRRSPIQTVNHQTFRRHRYVMQDYPPQSNRCQTNDGRNNPYGLSYSNNYHNHNNNVVDQDMDEWIDTIMEELQDFSRQQLQWELQMVEENAILDHHRSATTTTTTAFGSSSSSSLSSLSKEQLVCRILKARLQSETADDHGTRDSTTTMTTTSTLLEEPGKGDDRSQFSSTTTPAWNNNNNNSVLHQHSTNHAHTTHHDNISPKSIPRGPMNKFFPPLNHHNDDEEEEEPIISSFQDNGNPMLEDEGRINPDDIHNGLDRSPNEHWSSTTTTSTTTWDSIEKNNLKGTNSAAISLNDVDDSRQHRQAYFAQQQQGLSSQHQGDTSWNGGTGGSNKENSSRQLFANTDRVKRPVDWHSDNKRTAKSSSFSTMNHFIIDEDNSMDDLAADDIIMRMGGDGSASFADTGRSTFPDSEYDDTVVTPRNHHDGVKKPSRFLYTPELYPQTNAHESSTSSPFVAKQQRSNNNNNPKKNQRIGQVLELPMIVQDGIPTVQLQWQTQQNPDEGHRHLMMTTTFVIDTARYVTALPDIKCSQLHESSSSNIINTKSANQLLKSGMDTPVESALWMISSSNSVDHDDMVSPSDMTHCINPTDPSESTITPFLLSAAVPNENDKLLVEVSPPNPWLVPEPPIGTPYKTSSSSSIPLGGFWTDQDTFFAADILADIVSPEEQILPNGVPHGCLGMDVLGSFDVVELDFDNGVLRLQTNNHVDDPQSVMAITEASVSPLPLQAEQELYTLPLRVDGRGPVNMLISTALSNTVMTWKGVNDALGLSRHSNEVTDIEGTFSPYSTIASHFTHHLHVFRKLDFGTGKRLIRMNEYLRSHQYQQPSIVEPSSSLPGIINAAGMVIPIGQFPTNIGYNEQLNRAFERKRTGGIVGMDILSQCSVLRLTLGNVLEIQMLGRQQRPPSNHQYRGGVVLRP